MQNTIVFVFLRGGADTLNILVPYADDRYYQQRPALGIKAPSADKDSGLKLDDHYAFHPAMAPLLPWFKDGALAAVQGVGNDNASGSHFECQDQMEHGEDSRHSLGGGWIGRYLRTKAGALSPLSAVALSPTLPESLRGAPSATALRSLEDLDLKVPGGQPANAVAALAKLYGAETGLLATQGKETLAVYQKIRELRGQAYQPANGAEYPKTDFAKGLTEIARLVKGDLGLEVACIDVPNWDTHFVQGSATGLQADRITELSGGLNAFWKDLGTGMKRVTTVVFTEFGRRLYENSSAGTDHGRGFALMTCGGGVKGGRILGPWPVVEDEPSPGPGGLKIVHDYRSVFGEILAGATGCTALDKVFPGTQMKPVGLFG